MFEFLSRRFRDMGRLTKLFNEAERLANEEGRAEPGAEHMVMAALCLPEDDSARRALASLGGTPEGFRAAVEQQYADALEAIGIATPPFADEDPAPAPAARKKGLYRGSRSLEDLMEAVTADKASRSTAAMISAEIILGATRAQSGVVARAIARMGLEREQLADAARAVISKTDQAGRVRSSH